MPPVLLTTFTGSFGGINRRSASGLSCHANTAAAGAGIRVRFSKICLICFRCITPGAARIIEVMRDTDVLVIGGGPAGLSAALAISRKGLRVMVADGNHPPIDKACGEGLLPDSRAAA